MTPEEKKSFNKEVSERVKTVCTAIADNVCAHLRCKGMTKKEFSKRTKISKWRLKRIFDGNYGGISLKDIVAIEVEFSGENDKATRKVITEKYRQERRM